ncbi:MAG: transposase [Candidatus Edwardsbacteria bacterium]
MSLYKNKYRVQSTRLRDWDYTTSAYYYVTICTKDRKCTLGEFVNGRMRLSNIGKIAEEYLRRISEHFPHAKFDEYVVMPNHVHEIIIIENDIVETCDRVSLQKNEFSKPISGSLSVIVNQYKSSVKRWCNQNGCSYFEWQKSYYEHIIVTGEKLFIPTKNSDFQSDYFLSILGNYDII